MKPENFRVQYLPPKPQPSTIYKLLSAAWKAAYGGDAPRASIELLMAHEALETGWWAHMPNYNLGGIRPASEDDVWTAFATFEDLDEAVAPKMGYGVDPGKTVQPRGIAPEWQAAGLLQTQPCSLDFSGHSIRSKKE